MMQKRGELLAAWLSVRNWSAEEASRFLDLLHGLETAIWALHEDALLEICRREFEEPPHCDNYNDDGGDPEADRIPF